MPVAAPQEKWLTTKEAAFLLGLNPRYFRATYIPTVGPPRKPLVIRVRYTPQGHRRITIALSSLEKMLHVLFE